MFRAPSSLAGDDAATWRRDAYKVALIGPESIPHQELVARAGYQVVVAADGDAASDLFGRGLTVDAIVLDFSADGRPPEAVLLFARRTSAGAPVIAIVPADKNEAYRRAFLAGARDVLPAPARGEDLLASVDLVLEPRGLAEVVEELRAQSFEDEEGTVPHAPVPAGTAQRLLQLESEVKKKEQEIEDLVKRRRSGTASFRQQALDAITARDRAIESRERVKQKLTQVRRELKEKDAQLRLTERACEELTNKLKEARDVRRRLETRVLEAEERAADLERIVVGETRPLAVPPLSEGTPAFPSPSDLLTLPPDAVAPPLPPSSATPSRPLAIPLDAVRPGGIRPDSIRPDSIRPDSMEGASLEKTRKGPLPVEVDPEEGLAARQRDEEALEEMEEVFERYQASLVRIEHLEAALDGRTEPGRPLEAIDPAEALDARLIDEGRLEELEQALADKNGLVAQIAELESQLRQRDAELRATHATSAGEGALALEVALGELDSIREAQAETLGTLNEVKSDRDSLKHRLSDVEREAADVLTRLEELEPLAEEVERLRRELHAEHASHKATRERLSALEPQPQVAAELLGAPTTSGSWDSGTPADVWQRADQLQFELDRASAELEVAEKLRSDLEERLAHQDAELQSLRVVVAALTRDRSGEARTDAESAKRS